MSLEQWLPRVDRAQRRATRRVILLPHAGGGVAAWVRFGAALDPDVEFRVARLPSRESRLTEPPVGDAALVIKELARAAEELEDLPQVVVGHSLGALLGFALCSRLRVAPQALVTSGQTSPRCFRDYGDLLGLDDSALAVAANDKWGGIPAELLGETEILGLFLAALRSDLHVAASFPTDLPALDGIPVDVFAGEQDPLSPEGLADWSTRSSGEVCFHCHVGGHMAILDDPAVTAMVACAAQEHIS